MKYLPFVLIIFGFLFFANAQGVLHQRYEVNVRVAKPLPPAIGDNLTLISNSLNKIKAVAAKINNYENTNTWSTDNTNAAYRTFTASFAVPYPLPQTYLDEQATLEGYLVTLSNNAMPGTGTYTKIVHSHICNNGLTPTDSCSGANNY